MKLLPYFITIIFLLQHLDFIDLYCMIKEKFVTQYSFWRFVMEQKWVVVISFDGCTYNVFGDFNSRGLAHEWLYKNGWQKSVPEVTRDTWRKYATQEFAIVLPLEVPS